MGRTSTGGNLIRKLGWRIHFQRLAKLLILSAVVFAAVAMRADSIAIATFSFSEDAAGTEASFSFSNLTNTSLLNTDVLYRLQTGGVLDGYTGTIDPLQTISFSVAPMFYQYGEFLGTLSQSVFEVGGTDYQTNASSLSMMLWSNTQGELGPGQNVSASLYVDATPMATPTPEPSMVALLGFGSASLLILRRRVSAAIHT